MSEFESKLIEDLKCTKIYFESIFMQFSYNKKTFIFENIYCPSKGIWTDFPSEMCKFFFYSALFSLTDLNFLVYSDIDLFKIYFNQKSFDFHSFMCCYGLNLTILRPTRITKHSKTLINKNLKYFGDQSLNMNSGVIVWDLSGKFPFFVRVNAPDSSVVWYDTCVHYKFSLKNAEHHRLFRSLLLQIPFVNYDESADVQTNCQNIIRDIITSYDTEYLVVSTREKSFRFL